MKESPSMPKSKDLYWKQKYSALVVAGQADDWNEQIFAKQIRKRIGSEFQLY